MNPHPLFSSEWLAWNKARVVEAATDRLICSACGKSRGRQVNASDFDEKPLPAHSVGGEQPAMNFEE
jgi:hypothetical protein